MNPTSPASRPLGFGTYILVWSAALFSGVLLDLAAPGGERSALIYIALVPLFIALVLTRREPRIVRLTIGFVTGLVFGSGVLRQELAASWIGVASTPDGEVASFGATVAGALALALVWSLFGLAAGPLLAARSTALAMLGVSSLWVGIEFAAGSWLPESFSCLVLGGNLSPDGALGRNADLAGVAGLSFLVVALNTALLIFFSRSGGWSRFWPLAAVASAGASLIARGALVQDDEFSTAPPVEIALLKLDSAGSPVLPGFLRHLDERPGADDRQTKIIVGSALEDDPGETLAEAVPPGTFFVAATDWSAGNFGGPAARVSVLGSAARPGEGEEERRLVAFASRRVSPARTDRLGVLAGSSARRPDAFRALTRQGAGALAVSERRARPLSPRLEARQLRALAFRAVENRRWIAFTSAGGRAATFDPGGRRFDQVLPAVEAATWTTIRFAERQSLFTRGGWLSGPICLLAALGTLGFGLLRPRRRRARDQVHRIVSQGQNL